MEDKFINKVTASFLADSYEEYAKKELQALKPWIEMVETPGCRSVLNGFSVFVVFRCFCAAFHCFATFQFS